MNAYIGIAILTVVVVYFVGIFNKLIRLRNQMKNAFSQIDVQLKRRYDLIPNLVETAKGYLKHERETLEAVIQARSGAQAAMSHVGNDPTNVKAMKEFIGAEQIFGQAMSKLLVTVEAYPELKANATMNQMMEELTSTENKVSFARQAYNDGVMEYNTQREVFPNSLVANNFRFEPGVLLEIENPKEREAVTVKF